MNIRPFSKVLVANRGEIAVRVIRGCHELGLQVVAVYSEADADAMHVRLADESECIGPAVSSESYLRHERVLEVAKERGCDAIHPGYGFLSENAGFAQAVIDAGLVWIGPPPNAMIKMGSKTGARQAMHAAGVPLVPGTLTALTNDEELIGVATKVGLPVMLKASAGGGGKGMRRVDRLEDLASALASTKSEARKSFGDDAVYVEKLVENARHVEVQVLADSHGTVVHLFERDCSIQRRHQKVIEESPCPVLPQSVRDAMTASAVRAAEAVDYVGAGTCEFLYDPTTEAFYFLEMNTRLQVEHPITEFITGVDLVQAQLRVAAGEPLWFAQDDLRINGHAIECRIYAEDARHNFRPSPGPLHVYREPAGPWVRTDSGVTEGMDVPIHYDPMVSKLIVWGPDRKSAMDRARRALQDYRIVGIPTSIPFFLAILDDEVFRSGIYDTGFITPEWLETNLAPSDEDAQLAAVIAAVARFEKDEAVQSPRGAAAVGSRWKWSRRGAGWGQR
jgi:acetyl-CoA carboxylase biotin carboxylase subunit